jgi:hypothetical protein
VSSISTCHRSLIQSVLSARLPSLLGTYSSARCIDKVLLKDEARVDIEVLLLHRRFGFSLSNRLAKSRRTKSNSSTRKCWRRWVYLAIQNFILLSMVELVHVWKFRVMDMVFKLTATYTIIAALLRLCLPATMSLLPIQLPLILASRRGWLQETKLGHQWRASQAKPLRKRMNIM